MAPGSRGDEVSRSSKCFLFVSCSSSPLLLLCHSALGPGPEPGSGPGSVLPEASASVSAAEAQWISEFIFSLSVSFPLEPRVQTNNNTTHKHVEHTGSNSRRLGSLLQDSWTSWFCWRCSYSLHSQQPHTVSSTLHSSFIDQSNISY